MRRLIDFFYIAANILCPLTWRGFLIGYGGCAHCRGTWNWKKNYSIPYGADSAMFPLCPRCFNFLTAEEVIKYSEDLASKWQQIEEKLHLFPSKDYGLLIQNVRKAIRYLKGLSEEEPPFFSPSWSEYVKTEQ